MSYYYLIASLPDLSLSEFNKNIDIDETLQFLHSNLDKEDRAISKYLFYPNDNFNLLNLIFKEYRGMRLPGLRSPSIFKKDDLGNFSKSKIEFPRYIMNFFEGYEDQFESAKMGVIEDGLWEEFYKETKTINNRFINSYYQFDKTLRGLVAVLNNRLITGHFSRELIDDQILKGLEKGATEKLSKEYLFLDELISILDSKEPDAIERTLDSIRWNYIDRFEPTSFFTISSVFGYILKLLIAKRWIDLEEKEGKEQFENLCDQAINASGLLVIEKI